MLTLRRARAILSAVALGMLAAAALLASCPVDVSAHPLGNFTINHYDRIDVSDRGIVVFSVLDMAEIPAFRERQQIDSNGDGNVDEQESEVYASGKVDDLRTNLALIVDGRKVELTDDTRQLTFPPGQGGLSLLRLTATYRATLPENWRSAKPKIQFMDTNYADRLGWREIIVRGGEGVEITGANVPSQDISRELTSYPQNSLSSPLDVRSATFAFQPGAGAPLAQQPDDQTRAVRGNPDSTLSRFAELISKRDLSFGAVVLALLAAALFGAFHALSPGHGKTIVGAYLVGSRGTARHALLLGLTVTATHTSTVYAVGFITLYLERFILPEDLYPWLGVASGALIITMGMALLVGRLRSAGLGPLIRQRLRRTYTATRSLPDPTPALAFAAAETPTAMYSVAPETHVSEDAFAQRAAQSSGHAAAAHTHDHPHDEDAHTAGTHSHGFGSHAHAIPGQDGEPVTWRTLIGLGIFGGLLPCPTAIVVMLSAISLHRVGFGLVLIVAFSVGLAAVLTGIGFALVFARSLPQRMPLLKRLGERANSRIASAAIRAIPVASAAAVVLAGAVVTLRALMQQGLL